MEIFNLKRLLKKINFYIFFGNLEKNNCKLEIFPKYILKFYKSFNFQLFLGNLHFHNYFLSIYDDKY